MCNHAVRESLDLDRSLGLDFDTAWPEAVETALRTEAGVERAGWAQALGAAEVREGWRRAFELQRQTAAEVALTVFFEDPGATGPTARLDAPAALVA